MNIEQRVKRIEEKLTINQAPKTLSELCDRFIQGEYGNVADLFRLIISGTHIDPGKYNYPKEIIELLMQRKTG